MSPGPQTVVGVDAGSVESLEISAGRDHSKWARLGAGAGALGFLILGQVICPNSKKAVMGCGFNLLGLSLLFGLPGGALAGAMAAPER